MLLNKKKKKKRSIRNHEIRIYRRKKKIDKIFELELDQRYRKLCGIKSSCRSDLLMHRCIGYRYKRVSVPSLSAGHVHRVRAVGWSSCAGVQEVRAVSWAAYGKTAEQRGKMERIEISANSHGHFYVGIHPNSIYREGSRVWLRGEGGRRRNFQWP